MCGHVSSLLKEPGCGDKVIKKRSHRFDRVLLGHGEAGDGTAEKGGGGEGSLEKQTRLFFKHLPKSCIIIMIDYARRQNVHSSAPGRALQKSSL